MPGMAPVRFAAVGSRALPRLLPAAWQVKSALNGKILSAILF